MSDFARFKKSFKGDIITPSDVGYEKAIARWATNAERKAKVVAFVRDAEDVVLAVKYAKENKLPVAIRGGGHSPSGASSSQDGLVIDLSRYLITVEVDAQRRLAVVGGGALWETVNKNAILHGLAAVGGTVNHVGVGGLTLGGGWGYLTAAHGLAIDNLIQVTIIIADGSILTASDTENSDLFWAIRGGGCNFGVCTEFVLKLHPQLRTVYAGAVVFPPHALEKVTKFTEEWWREGPSDKETLIHTLTRGPDGEAMFVVTIFYNGTEEEGRAHWKPLFDLGPVADMTKEIPYEELSALMNPFTPHGRPTCIKGVCQTKPRVDVVKQTFDRMSELSKSGTFEVILNLEYFPLDKVLSVPGDATAFRRRPFAPVLSIVRWTENTPENLRLGKSICHELADIVAKGNGDLTEDDGVNYSNYDPEVPLPEQYEGGTLWSGVVQTFFGSNYPKLQQLKKKYDPEMFFSKWFAITPA